MPVSSTMPWVPGQLIIMFRENLTDEVCRSIIAGQGHEIVKRLEPLTIYQIRVPVGHELTVANRYHELPGVSSAEPNYIATLSVD